MAIQVNLDVMLARRKMTLSEQMCIRDRRFDQGVREAVAYIYSHPECQRPDPAFDAWCDQVIEGYERLTAALPKFEM